MSITFTIILALLLDYLFAEPRQGHPLVLFGNLASALENQLLTETHKASLQKINGTLALLLAIIPITLIIVFVNQPTAINTLVAPLLLYLCIAPNSLKKHTMAVYQSLTTNQLPDARLKLAKIVSRETEHMDKSAIRKATIESTLENGADAVFAPIFWFIIAGPAGCVFYRLANTLDAMWGYKNNRYRHFGWAAARLDDLLNWIPARLTAISYALLGNTRQALTCWKQQAPHCASPNAGPVMASGAGAMNLILGGTAIYHGEIHDKPILGSGRDPVDQDIKRANFLVSLTLLSWTSVIMVGDIFV